MIRIVLLSIIIFSFTLVQPLYAEQNVAETVDAIIRAYGGEGLLASVKTIYAEGRIDDLLRKKSGNYARLMRRPGGLRIDIMPEQGGEVRILDGDRGWQGSGDRLHEASPISLSSMRYQYAYLDVPMSLADGSASAISVEELEFNGLRVLLLRIDTVGAPQLRVYVDPEGGLIHRVEATFSMGSMGSMQLGTEYENYQKVNGVPFPFTLNNFAGGRISTITLKNIRLNEPLPDDAFPTSNPDKQ